MIETMIKRKQAQRDALNWDDDAEVFVAHKEKATYFTGWIQGARYLLNDIKQAQDEEESIRSSIKELEAELKGRSKRDK